MITKVTLSGGFHNARPIELRIRDGEISGGQYLRLSRHMCRVKGCICGPRHGWEVFGMPRDTFLDALSDASYSLHATGRNKF